MPVVASPVFFDAFFEHEAEGVHNFASHTLKVLLTNDAPSAANDAVKADLTSELGTGGGYTSGGATVGSVTSTRSGAVYTLDGADVVITASGAPIGPFQYVVLYNDTPTSPADPMILYANYGAPVTVPDGESFTISFHASGIATKTSA